MLSNKTPQYCNITPASWRGWLSPDNHSAHYNSEKVQHLQPKDAGPTRRRRPHLAKKSLGQGWVGREEMSEHNIYFPDSKKILSISDLGLIQVLFKKPFSWFDNLVPTRGHLTGYKLISTKR